MTYTGNTIINPNITLRVSARQSLTGTGDVYLNGGSLQADGVTGQLRMIAPLTVSGSYHPHKRLQYQHSEQCQ